MICLEKEALQQSCTASWNTFETAITNLGITLDPTIGSVMPRLMKGLQGVEGLIDPQTGKLKTRFLDAILLLREHQKASSVLSAHLHTHRC